MNTATSIKVNKFPNMLFFMQRQDEYSMNILLTVYAVNKIFMFRSIPGYLCVILQQNSLCCTFKILPKSKEKFTNYWT